MKVYISSDMEGTAGVVLWEQVLASGDFERFRRIMTQEINAAVEGAVAAGAEAVVVNDSHGPMTNVVIDELHPDAELISGVNKTLLQVEGIGDGFDALFFTGYHQREGGGDGVLNHTILGNTIYEIRVNGEPVDEAALNAGVAGIYGVPVAFISGDHAVCSDAERRFPGVLTAPTKQAIDRYAARSLSCQKAQALIRERAQAAVEAVRAGLVNPFLFGTPVMIEVDFKATSSAHMTSLIPGVERVGPRAIVISSDDYLTAFRILVVAALFGSHTSMGKL
jgi:D-amino peptidase